MVFGVLCGLGIVVAWLSFQELDGIIELGQPIRARVRHATAWAFYYVLAAACFAYPHLK